MQPKAENLVCANLWADELLADPKYEVIPADSRKFVKTTDISGQEKWVQHNCGREKLHAPSAVQPHGYILVMRGEDLTVTQVSANFVDIGYEVNDLINVPLQNILDDHSFTELQETFMDKSNFKPMHGIPIEIGKGVHRKTFTGIFHRRGEWAYLEFEQHCASPNLEKLMVLLHDVNQQLFGASDAIECCQVAVEAVHAYTGYDRVMAYKFHEDKHGEIVAEKRSDGVESFLGLHFPAIDIPDQARALFIRNIFTHIPCVDHEEVPLVPECCPVTGQNPDMSLVCTRASSAGHLVYLSTMGVASTFVLALVVDSRLWGLIVCHNVTPKYLPFAHRVVTTLMAETVGLVIKLQQEKAEIAERQRAHAIREPILEHLHETDDFTATFASAQRSIQDLIDCTGACILHGDVLHKMGSTPTDSQIIDLVDYVGSNCSGRLCTNSLSKVYSAAEAFADVASGCLLMICSDGLVMKQKVAFMWFRQHWVKSIDWGGNPDSAYGPGGLQPRMSFKKFTSTAVVEAQPWGKVAVEAVNELIRGFLLHEAFKGCNQAGNLMETMNYKDQFLANVSHEIRTPLYAINALAELCLTKPYVPQEVREHLEMINESGTSLLGLLNDVIDVRRLEAGKLELRLQDVDVVGLARFCLKMFRKQATNKGLEGFIIYDDSLCNMNLRLDKTRMQQLIVNLVSNALKFTETGSITIRLSRDVPKNELTVLVMDTGIGIKPEHISRLFSKFSQVSNSDTKLFHGAGLGLSIVKQLVDLIGGQVGVDSEYQKGSHFWFTIPARPSASSEPPRQPCDGEGLAAVHKEKVIEAVPLCVDFPSSPSWSGCRSLQGEAEGKAPGPASQTSSPDTLPAALPSSSTTVLSQHRLEPCPQPDSDPPLQKQSSWWRKFLFCGGKQTRSPSPQKMTGDTSEQTATMSCASASPVQTVEHARPRILVADDNVVLQRVAAKMFEDLADVTIAQNGQEVLDILEADDDYGMILMDLQMPVLDGIAATKKIRENVHWDHIPIIGFTASSFSDEIAKCLAAGMSTLLTKPLPKATLNQFVDECINGKYQRPRTQPH